MTGGSVFRVVRSQDYVTISNYHLRDKRLSLAAKGLMSVLLADEGDTAWTMAEFQEMGPEGRDAIRSALKKLEDAGYIQRRRTHDGAGRFASNEYLIYGIPSSEKPSLENPTMAAPSAGKPSTENPTMVTAAPDLGLDQGLDTTLRRESVSPLRENKEKDIKSPTRSPAGGPKWKPARFAAFWHFYRTHCRGESKQAAIRAWDRLKPDDALIEEIGRALQRQLRTEEWRRGIGIPYASTYLNQRRWEDGAGPRRTEAAPVLRDDDVEDWTPGGAP